MELGLGVVPVRVGQRPIPGGERGDSDVAALYGTGGVLIRGEDPLAMFRSFVAVTYITRAAEGR